jgi:hypothetical protein
MTIKLGPKTAASSTLPSSRRSTVLANAARAAALAALAASPLLPARAANITSTWGANPTGIVGNWNEAAKWLNSPTITAFPNNGNLSNTYDAIVGQGQVTLNLPVTLRTLTLNGGTIGAPTGTATVNGINVTSGFTFNGGTLNVPVMVPAGATFTLGPGTNSRTLGAALTIGGGVALAGTDMAYTLTANAPQLPVNLTSTATWLLDRRFTLLVNSPNLIPNPSLRPSAVLNNGGTITLARGGILEGLPPGRLNNAGVIRVTGASEIAFPTFQSTGLIDLQTSTAALNMFLAPGLGSTELAGSVRLAAGSALTFTRGGVVFAAPSVTNAGTINIRSSSEVAAPTTLPGVVNFGTNYATLTLNSDLTLTGRSVFSNGSTIDGTGRLTAHNLKPEGVTVGGRAELNIPAGGTLDMGNNTWVGLAGGSVSVGGTAVWDQYRNGSVGAGGTNVGRFDVRAGGLLDIRPSAAATWGGRSGNGESLVDVLANAGEIRVDRAVWSLGRSWSLSNAGVVRLLAGSTATLTSVGVTNSGTIELEPGGTLLVNADRYANALPEFRITPTGVVRVGASATATFDTPYFRAPLENAGLIEVNGGRLTSVDYTLSNSGTVRVTAGLAQFGGALTNTGRIAAAGGSVEFTAPATNSGLIEVGAGAALSVGWALHNPGVLRVSGGNLTIATTAVTNSGTIDLRAGATAVFKPGSGWSDPMHLAAEGSLLVGGSSTATFTSTYSNSGLYRLSNAGLIEIDGGRVSVQASWAFANSGTIRASAGGVLEVAGHASNYTNSGSIDLRSGAGAVFHSGSGQFTAAGMRAQILSGRHAGAWDGPGINSASAAADPTTAVGYAVATAPGTFLGVAVAAGDILVRHTKSGDASLDGVVNFADLLALAKNYNGSARHWFEGDFNYDGTVNFSDLLALAKNYNQSLPTDPVPGAPAAFNADLANAFAQVPEPSTALFALAAACGFALSTRRRRTRSAR